jgi:hypothetical protein
MEVSGAHCSQLLVLEEEEIYGRQEENHCNLNVDMIDNVALASVEHRFLIVIKTQSVHEVDTQVSNVPTELSLPDVSSNDWPEELYVRLDCCTLEEL